VQILAYAAGLASTHFDPEREYCGARSIGLLGSFQASQSFTVGKCFAAA
jgi:hypothetical protein